VLSDRYARAIFFQPPRDKSLSWLKKRIMDKLQEPRNNVPSQKKILFPIKPELRRYLLKYAREVRLPVHYSDPLRFTLFTPLRDKEGKDTLWHTVYYDESEMKELFPNVTYIYALMNADGDTAVMEHL